MLQAAVMSAKRNGVPVARSMQPALHGQLAVAAIDLASSDRIEFSFKRRFEKIDWRKIGRLIFCVS